METIGVSLVYATEDDFTSTFSHLIIGNEPFSLTPGTQDIISVQVPASLPEEMIRYVFDEGRGSNTDPQITGDYMKELVSQLAEHANTCGPVFREAVSWLLTKHQQIFLGPNEIILGFDDRPPDQFFTDN